MTLFAVALLAGISGCRRKKSPEGMGILQVNQDIQETKQVKSLFVDDVDAFVFEEDANPFSSEGTTSGLSIVAIENGYTTESHKFAFKSIYFDFDQYALRQDQKDSLQMNLVKIKDAIAQGYTVVIEGHSCKFAGSSVYNMMLSEKRAKAVASYFIKQGIPAAKIKVVGRGNEMCIVAEGDRDAQAPNRRVEIHIIK